MSGSAGRDLEIASAVRSADGEEEAEEEEPNLATRVCFVDGEGEDTVVGGDVGLVGVDIDVMPPEAATGGLRNDDVADGAVATEDAARFPTVATP